MLNYLLESPSPSLISLKIKEIVTNHSFTDATITTYDLEEKSLQDVIEDANTISFLTPKKVIIATNFNKNKDDLKVLEAYLDHAYPDVLLIITTDKIDKRRHKNIIKKLTYLTLEVKASNIISTSLTDYKVDFKVKRLLEEYYQNDLERLIREIEKLKLAFMNTKEITYQDAFNLLEKPLDNQDNLSFALVRNMALKDKKEALITYQELLNYNIECYSIIGLLESQYRLLYQVKVLTLKRLSSKEISEILEVHPYRVKKSLELLSYYTLKELRLFLKKLAKTDYYLKSGKISSEFIIDLLILNN